MRDLERYSGFFSVVPIVNRLQRWLYRKRSYNCESSC